MQHQSEIGWCIDDDVCIDRSMQKSSEKPYTLISWGVAASIVLHVVVAAVFLLQFPLELPKPEDESIKVELVSLPKPAEAKPLQKEAPAPAMKPPEPSKTEALPGGSSPAPPQPQAFESGPQKADKGAPEGEETAEATPEKAQPPKLAASQEPSESPDAKTDPTKYAAPPKLEAMAANVADGGSAPKDLAESERPVQVKRAATGAKSEDEKPKAASDSDRKPDKLKKAKGLYSKKMLADPRVKQALGELPPNRRIVQLCSIEALEQVRHARPDAFPDALVPYAWSGGIIENHVLRAKGGAFRSKNNWHNVDFRCEVNADTTEVVAFSFAIGGAVPKSQWQARRLKVDDGAGTARAPVALP